MPKVLAAKTIECVGCDLQRQILRQNGIDLYNSDAKVINYRLNGSSNSCAVPSKHITGTLATVRGCGRCYPHSYTRSHV